MADRDHYRYFPRDDRWGGRDYRDRERDDFPGGRDRYGRGRDLAYGYGRGRSHGEYSYRDYGRDFSRDFGRDFQRESERDFPEGGARNGEGRSGTSKAGLGPRNYRRSDERIQEDVCRRLEDHPELDATDVEVQVKSGAVRLAGTVENRRERRLAEEIAESVWGATDVHNELRVEAKEKREPDVSAKATAESQESRKQAKAA